MVRAPFLLRARTPSFTAAAAFSLSLVLSRANITTHIIITWSALHLKISGSSQTATILRLGSQPLPPRRLQFLKLKKNEVQDLLLVKTVWINCELRTGQGYGCHQHSCHFSTVNWQLYLYLSILYLYLRLWQGCHQDASLLSTAQCRLQL